MGKEKDTTRVTAEKESQEVYTDHEITAKELQKDEFKSFSEVDYSKNTNQLTPQFCYYGRIINCSMKCGQHQ